MGTGTFYPEKKPKFFSGLKVRVPIVTPITTVESLSLLYLLFFYLDSYILGDDALISLGSFMQTKLLCVLIHILTKGEVGAPLNRFKPSSIIFY